MVTFTATLAADFTMMATFDADRYTDVTDAAGETVNVNGADMSAIIFDDSAALETYETAQLEADDAWVAPDYTDGYAMTIQVVYNANTDEITDQGVCVTGTSPAVGDAAAIPFTSCVDYTTYQVSPTTISYTTDVLAADDDDITTYTEVTEADNIGYSASWTATVEDTTDSWMEGHSTPFEQTTAVFSRFLPSLSEDGAYSSTDLRFDADTTGGKICFSEGAYTAVDANDAPTFSCLATVDAEGEALWAGAATIYAGAAVAIAATLF